MLVLGAQFQLGISDDASGHGRNLGRRHIMHTGFSDVGIANPLIQTVRKKKLNLGEKPVTVSNFGRCDTSFIGSVFYRATQRRVRKVK